MSGYSKMTQQKVAWGIAPYASGTIHVKQVRCGKPNCHTCPHASYAYYRLINGRFRHEQYLGACDGAGFPQRNLKLL